MHLELIRDPRPDFPELPAADAVTTARVWHCKFRSLAPVSRLTNVAGLVIATYPDHTLEPLQSLAGLRHLTVVHLPKIDDLSPLARLPSLAVLSLSTLPSWDSSNRRTRVRSLLPLLDVPRLHHLELLGVVPDDDSLTAVAASTTLVTARLHGYRAGEVEAFFERSGAMNVHAPEPWF